MCSDYTETPKFQWTLKNNLEKYNWHTISTINYYVFSDELKIKKKNFSSYLT